MARNTGRPEGSTHARPPFAEAKKRGGAFGHRRIRDHIRNWLFPEGLHDVEEDE